MAIDSSCRYSECAFLADHERIALGEVDHGDQNACGGSPRTYFQAYAAAVALYCVDKALDEIRAGHTKTWSDFTVPKDAIGCGFHEAVRGVLSHHMVIENGKIANYHPYPPTPWNASVRDIYGTPGPYEDAVQNTPIFEENERDNFKGIDIMRTVRSFDPCLPCGVHMYLGEGKELQLVHSPTFGITS
jgi:hydrogenase large subunit